MYIISLCHYRLSTTKVDPLSHSAPTLGKEKYLPPNKTAIDYLVCLLELDYSEKKIIISHNFFSRSLNIFYIIFLHSLYKQTNFKNQALK